MVGRCWYILTPQYSVIFRGRKFQMLYKALILLLSSQNYGLWLSNKIYIFYFNSWIFIFSTMCDYNSGVLITRAGLTHPTTPRSLKHETIKISVFPGFLIFKLLAVSQSRPCAWCGQAVELHSCFQGCPQYKTMRPLMNSWLQWCSVSCWGTKTINNPNMSSYGVVVPWLIGLGFSLELKYLK